jgi:hypothetical protein
LPVAAGAAAVGELVGAAGEDGDGAAGDAGLGADGFQDVGAGSAACEEPKMAETSLPKMLMVTSSGEPCAVFPNRAPEKQAWVHVNTRDAGMFRREYVRERPGGSQET